MIYKSAPTTKGIYHRDGVDKTTKPKKWCFVRFVDLFWGDALVRACGWARRVPSGSPEDLANDVGPPRFTDSD